ncbi:MAG TPA: hypothetical protein DEP36_09650 [Gammaproteobacteria bacterium]|nr:hypothetical protein [Gammaproteobacteria bacterium]HRF45856.1 hypothetical protein [Candidatus Competibacteraceae bacterium]
MAEKNELRFQHGLNFNKLPAWQKRAMGVYWATWAKPGQGPRSGQTVMTPRRQLIMNQELPQVMP